MKVRLPQRIKFRPSKGRIFLTIAIVGAGLAGAIFMLQDRQIANRTAGTNTSPAHIETQQQTSAEVDELKKTQSDSIANPNAKPGEIGEILLDQPKKGIKYIRAGTLVITPSTFTCNIGDGYSCTAFTMSASDGRPIMSAVEQNRNDIWLICRENCFGQMQEPSHRKGIDFSNVGPGTYTLELKAHHIDQAGNHLIYFGSVTLTVKDPGPSYIPPPEPEYDMGTPPFPWSYTPPPGQGYCDGAAAMDPECN